MTNILSPMKNFIPHPVAEALAQGKDSGTFQAVGLFLDISGFTKMTEALMEHGKSGAGELSRIINSVFEPMMDGVYSNDGFVTTFAGDAFTALFRGGEEERRSHALAAALSVMRVFTAAPVHKTDWGDFVLRAKVGLAPGHVSWGLLGERGRRGYYFRGEAVDGCARAEHACEPGTIAVARSLGPVGAQDFAEVAEDVDGFRVVKPVRIGDGPTPRADTLTDIPLDIVSEFVPVERFPVDSPGEFRNIASAFVAFDESVDDVEKVFSVVSSAAVEHGGYLNLLDFGDKGGLCLVLFGAPQSIEDSAGSGMDFSLAVRDALPAIRIGLALGQCFTGYVGSNIRASYTALGRVVNLSARLAGSAKPGEILLPQRSYERLAGRFSIAPLGARELKGFGQPIGVANLAGRLQSGAGYQRERGVGRTEEKGRLRAWVQEIAQQRRGAVFTVLGELGMGKSQLAADVLAEPDLPARYIIVSYDHVFQRSFNPFVGYFRDIFREHGAQMGKDQSSSVREAFDSILRAEITEDLPEYLKNELKRAGPSLAWLADLSWDDGMFDSLDAQARHDRTIEAMVAWYSSLAHARPLILVVEQASDMDSGSREFWDRLIPRSQDLPLGVLYLARGTNTQELPQARETLVLQPFIESDLQAFAEQSLGRPADEGLLDFLERRTNRIPLFVAELLRFLREHGLLIIGEDKARLGQVDGATLPASLQDLMLAELDGLPSDLKSGLPQLAVLGQRFPRKLCERLFGDQSPAVVTAYVQAGILEEADEEVRFTREIMRDTIYRIQLDARLKELHARAAELWISSTPEETEASAEKAYHLHKAGRETEARGFYRIAAEQARLNFLNAEALRHYDNFLSLSDDEEANCLVRLDRAVIYELIGEWNNAIVELERGIGLAAISGHEELFSRFFAMIGQMRFKLGAHDAARVHLEKAIRDPRTRALLPPLVQSRIDLARVYILEGSYGEALNRLLEARDLAVEQGYHHEHALALYYLGVVYRTRGRKKEALDAYQESLRIFRNLRVPRYIAYPLYDLSLMYQYEGQLDKAHQSMQEALTIYTQIGYKSGLGAALLNMGAIEDQRGNFQAALDLFTRSRNITEELGEHLGVAYALFSIGASAYKAQEYAQALSYLNDADELVSRLRVDSYRGYALSYLACVLVRLGRFSEAIERVQEQLDVMERIKDDVEKGRIFLALAEICERAEQTDPILASKLPELAARVGLEKSSALRWYRQAIKASLPSRYVNTLIPALYHCGLYLTRVRSDSAGRYLTRALQEAKRAGWTTYVERIETTLEGKAADRADKELLAASPSVDGR